MMLCVLVVTCSYFQGLEKHSASLEYKFPKGSTLWKQNTIELWGTRVTVRVWLAKISSRSIDPEAMVIPSWHLEST